MPRPRIKTWAALGVTSALLLTGCAGGDDGPKIPGGSDPWPISPPPNDPEQWIADQRNLPTPQATADGPSESLAVKVQETPTGSSYSRAGAGISFEATDLADERLSADNADLVRILGQMDRPTLRFGGNSVDRRFFFTSTGEPTPTDWPLRPRERITTVTPEDLQRLAALADATDAQVVLSVNLAAEDPARAASLVAHGKKYLGDRLAGVMIGNEPNGYALGKDNPLSIKGSSWDPEAFTKNWRSYVSAIRTRVPGTTIAGPGAYDETWWRTVTDSGLTGTALAVHQYPLSECGDPEDTGYMPGQAPTIKNTVSRETRERVDDLLGRAVAMADAEKMPTWITETSASSCSGGNDLTETSAAGLYTADYLLRAQRLGIERVDFHSALQPCAGGPPMSVLCSSGTIKNPGSAFVPRTNGLALALVGSLPEGRFLETSATFDDAGPTDGADGQEVTTYAMEHDDGTHSVVVVDFRDPEQTDDLALSIDLPHGVDSASVTSLAGDTLTENYPESSLFDGTPSAEGPTTQDHDGVAMDLRSAVTAVEKGRPSVDGYGLPLLPSKLQPQVTDMSPGDRRIRTVLPPGSVSVISTSTL